MSIETDPLKIAQRQKDAMLDHYCIYNHQWLTNDRLRSLVPNIPWNDEDDRDEIILTLVEMGWDFVHIFAALYDAT